MVYIKRINIITGHYGSGKTEVAINYALWLKKQGKKVVLVDLDIVNPYFRTKDAEEKLLSMGVRVIAPDYANTNLDLPTLPGEISSVFDNKEETVVFDVGGDDDGAIALGRYSRQISAEQYEMFMVINPKRPESAEAENVKRLRADIESASRLKITKLINNTNLQRETTSCIIKDELSYYKKLENELGLETAFLCATPEVLKELDAEKTPFLELELFLKLPF